MTENHIQNTDSKVANGCKVEKIKDVIGRAKHGAFRDSW